MTAPARATPPSGAPTPPTRTRTRANPSNLTNPAKPTRSAQPRQSTQPRQGEGVTRLTPTPERSGASRARSAAAERAYARRAQRTQRMVGPRAERGPRPAGRVSFVVLVISLLVAGVVATLWLSTQATADSYKLAQAQQDTGALSEQVQSMQQQVAQGNSPEALAARAKQLGMVPAGDPAHLVVGPDGSVTVVGTPSAATAPPPPAPPPATPPSRPSTTAPANHTTTTPPTIPPTSRTPAGG